MFIFNSRELGIMWKKIEMDMMELVQFIYIKSLDIGYH
jgi:hypothetical protein